MGFVSINDYIVPLIRILIDFLAVGTVVRCVYLLMCSIGGEEDFSKVFSKVKKRMIAGVFSICAVEVLYYIASLYGL